MRIVQAVNVRWYNATAWYGVELARLATLAGHRCLVLGLENTEPLFRARELGLDTRALPLNAKNPLSLPGLYSKMSKLVDEFKPDVINCHRGESFALWGMLKKRKQFALIRTRGDQRLPRSDALNRWLHTRAADAVIATNSRMADYFTSRMGVAPSKVHCIIGGVDFERFAFDREARSRMRAKFGYGEDNFVLGLLGRFDHVKGQRECLHAIRQLKDQGFNHLRLLLIGFSTAVDESEVRAWIRELDIADMAQITGHVPDVADCICACDLGVIASLGSEAIARAALEIMSCGLPLISTSTGVMPDLLPAWAMCPPGDIDALARLIQLAACDARRRKLLREECAKRIQTLGSRDFVNQTLTVYDQAFLEGRCPSKPPSKGSETP